MNIKLNPGGLIGALAFGAVVAFTTFNTAQPDKNATPIRLSIIALVVGAFAGNFLWAKVFKPRGKPSVNEIPEQSKSERIE